MDYTINTAEQNPEPPLQPQKAKRPLWIRILRFSAKTILFLFVFSILWVVVLKWMPVYVTPHMLIQSGKVYWEGKDSKIDYEWVGYQNISEHAFVAVVASEDQKFPTHNGFDFEAIELAIKENEKGGQTRGASTISQQVAKNVFLTHSPTYARKALEAYFTVLIELIWGKKRIIEVYLNIAEMGYMTFGVQAASKKFFHKNAHAISPYEAATLAAVLPNPIRFSAQNPDWYVVTRRNQVLYQMQMLGGFSYLQGIW